MSLFRSLFARDTAFRKTRQLKATLRSNMGKQKPPRAFPYTDDSRQPRARRLIKIYALGGTIVGETLSAGKVSEYEPGAGHIQSVLNAIPGMSERVDCRVDATLFNGGSPDMTDKVLINLAKAIERDFQSDADIDGWVVTHGTDTLEETAFFLDSTRSDDMRKPIVVTGAMRPANSISSDGSMNLAEAICVAAAGESATRPVMVVLNDLILPARFAAKTSANSLDAFQAGPFGAIGIVRDLKPIFYLRGDQGTASNHFSLDQLDAEKGLPSVAILYGHPDMHPQLAAKVVEMGARGLILAGMGAGCWTNEAGAELKKVALPRPGSSWEAERDDTEGRVPVVASFRTAWGFVGNDSEVFGLGKLAIGSGFLNPCKARIQLQLCLATGADFEERFRRDTLLEAE